MKGRKFRRAYRRRMKRMRRKYKKVALVNTALNPIPQRYFCKMKYVENLQLGSIIQPKVMQLLKLNGLIKPTGVLHNPYGFNTFAKLYTGYKVWGVSWRVSCAITTGGAVRSYYIGCCPENYSQTPPTATGISDFTERPRTKYFHQLVSAPEKYIKGHVSLPSLMGVSKKTYAGDNANYGSSTAGNPALPANLEIMISTLDELTTIGTDNIDLTIEAIYHVEWYSPIIQLPS